MYHSASQAVGPALVRAYRTYLEAGYPRIAVERDLALDFSGGKLESFEIIRRDDDGVYYLDVLAQNPWYPGVPYDRDKLLQIIKKTWPTRMMTKRSRHGHGCFDVCPELSECEKKKGALYFSG